jgi:D-alanine-D-alanine ligase|tara:strand:+ start:143 stop:1129 length:987 start_codon:yes stop_codon:yes gene_type:complete
MKKNIAIIMGGYSSEYLISLKSGSVVFDSLTASLLYTPYCVHIFKDKWVYVDEKLEEHPVNKADFSISLGANKITFDCVFNAIHGAPGENGILQAYFELLSIPHTSCNMYQAALTFNKRDCLSVLKSYGILSAEAYFLNAGDPVDSVAIEAAVGFPCFVKANRSGSSFGVTKVYSKEELPKAIEAAFKEDNELIIEAFLDGTEVSVGVIRFEGEIQVLPITEIVTENDFFDYEAKYLGKSQEITPARISDSQAAEVTKIAKTIYEVLKLEGFSRSEFIFKNNKPHLLEVNTIPGFTRESILPQQALKAGISLADLFHNAIHEALHKNH